MAPVAIRHGDIRIYIHDQELASTFLTDFISMSHGSSQVKEVTEAVKATLSETTASTIPEANPSSNISGYLSDRSGSMAHVSSQVAESPEAVKAKLAEIAPSAAPEANIATIVGQHVQDNPPVSPNHCQPKPMACCEDTSIADEIGVKSAHEGPALSTFLRQNLKLIVTS